MVFVKHPYFLQTEQIVHVCGKRISILRFVWATLHRTWTLNQLCIKIFCYENSKYFKLKNINIQHFTWLRLASRCVFLWHHQYLEQEGNLLQNFLVRTVCWQMRLEDAEKLKITTVLKINQNWIKTFWHALKLHIFVGKNAWINVKYSWKN